jgi:hypothetical protein
MRRAGTWVGVAAALAFALVTAPSHAQGDLVPAARAEGRVVVYGTMAADNFDVIARIFKGRYGVDAEYWRAAPDRLLDRVLSELRARRVMFDVVIGPSYALRLLKRQGAFARYASPSYELFPRPTWDKDGVFSPLTGSPRWASCTTRVSYGARKRPATTWTLPTRGGEGGSAWRTRPSASSVPPGS